MAAGATWAAFDDGFHPGSFAAAVGLIAGIALCAALIAQAGAVLERVAR